MSEAWQGATARYRAAMSERARMRSLIHYLHYSKGFKRIEIARALHISRERVRQIIERVNVTISESGEGVRKHD